MKPAPRPDFPVIFLADHQVAVAVAQQSLVPLLDPALAAVLEQAPGPSGSLLAGLDEIEISILSDPELGRQHELFLGDPSPTDVITFQHGELLLSADTAAREATQRKHSVERELLLYAVHGFLHLHGYDDHSEPDQQRMDALQDQIMRRIWPC